MMKKQESSMLISRNGSRMLLVWIVSRLFLELYITVLSHSILLLEKKKRRSKSRKKLLRRKQPLRR
jgi:hypothetical protein